MKLTFEKEHIQSVLSFVQNIVNPKSTVSILSNVLIETTGDKTVTLTATDLEIGAKCNIPATIIDPGSTTLPAKRLLDVVKDFPIKEITIDVSDKNIATISSTSTTAKIVGLPKDEFPQFPEIKSDNEIILPQKTLKSMFQKTVYAISDDTTRYVLTGLYVLFNENELSVVSTDGKRLAVVKEELDIKEKLEIIIPSKTIHELLKILKDEGDIKVSIIGNQVAFILDSVIIVSRLIEGHFPDYKQVIPAKTEEKLTLNRDELLKSLSRASIFTDKKSNSIKISCQKNKLIISANISEVGECREEIDLPYDGKEMTIAFNPYYIADVLKIIENEDVIIELIDSESPGVIRNGENFTYVIMPMRIT